MRRMRRMRTNNWYFARTFYLSGCSSRCYPSHSSIIAVDVVAQSCPLIVTSDARVYVILLSRFAHCVAFMLYPLLVVSLSPSFLARFTLIVLTHHSRFSSIPVHPCHHALVMSYLFRSWISLLPLSLPSHSNVLLPRILIGVSIPIPSLPIHCAVLLSVAT